MSALAQRNLASFRDQQRIYIVRLVASITCLYSLPHWSLAVGAAESARATPEEVIVTAQRRSEDIADVPISIGVLSGEDLDRGSSRSVADVLNQVGGVSLIETQPGKVQIAVRGVLSELTAGASPIGYYVDEVPFTFINTAELPDTNAFDLARVEVLRGPQGTLYGANALSGVVRVLTNDANLNDFEAKSRLRGSHTEGSDDNYGADLAVNVPLIPGKLAIRAVAGYSDMSGFIDTAANCFPGCTPGVRNINDTEAQSYRFKINYQPIEDLSFRFGFWRSEIDSGNASTGRDDYTTRFSAHLPDERVVDIYNLITDYHWSSVSLLSATGYLEYDGLRRREIVFLGSLLPIVDTLGLESFSQEIRLSSELQGAWQWSAGAFYKDTTDSTIQDPLRTIPGNLVADYRSESYAVFGELTRAFDEGRFELTGGLRYFEDHFEVVQFEAFSGPPAPPQKATFDKVTWRTLLAYKPNTDSMFYGAVATGFRSGRNQSFSALSFNPDFPAINPDSLITYELGAKGRLFDGTLSYDTAVYYTDWKDILQSLTIPQGFTGYLNAGTASGVGVDMSLVFQLTPALSFQANIGWNDLILDEDVFSGTAILFRKGSRINNSPEWSGSVGASYTTPTPMSDVDFVLSSNFAYASARISRYLTGTTPNQSRSDAVGNLKVSAGLASDRWTLELYGENLANEDGAVVAPLSSDDLNAVRYRPRTIGLQATFSY